MKPFIKELGMFGMLGILLPGIVFYFASAETTKDDISKTQTAAQQTEVNHQNNEDATNICILYPDNRTGRIQLDVYVTGVVAAEMPASFEEDALKAQAVAARTYALRRAFTSQKHDNADLCTNAACCQAYFAYDDYLERGGTQEDYERIQSCVEATAGQVLTYEEELIEATYFSCSGGMTEDAQAVWGTEIAYLIAQPSPGEEKSQYHTQTFIFSKNDLLKKLAVTDSELNEPLIGSITYTQGGGVETVSVMGKTFTGVELRQKLALPSTYLQIYETDDGIAVTTQGYGHRVGMSQYGADAMAVSGSTYQQILAYYYPGTELTHLRMD